MGIRANKILRFFTSMLVLIGLLALATSCLQANQNRRRAIKKNDQANDENTDSTGNSGNNATKNEGPTNQSFFEANAAGEEISVSLRHIVDPRDGTYNSKVTIPKNFSGLLYLSGLNVTSLADRLITVRFRFGRNLEPIDVPATVARAPGIIPQTDIEVLVLDLDARPFLKIRLLYDLFDYNVYDEAADAPKTDNRDSGLYCRGLLLEHDSTFRNDIDSNNTCNSADEVCRYAYAKITDKGVVVDYSGINIGPAIPLLPTEPQIDLGGGTSYVSDTVLNKLKKCLPDNGTFDKTDYDSSLPASTNDNSYNPIDRATMMTDFTTTAGSFEDATNLIEADLASTTVTPDEFYYQGPYRSLSPASWEISSLAVYGTSTSITDRPHGIFASNLINTDLSGYTFTGTEEIYHQFGFHSYLFPRGGKVNLSAGVQYVGLSDPFTCNAATTGCVSNTKSVQSLASNGESLNVSGCSMRMMNRDEINNEGIGSCNVTATIELVVKDSVTGEETLVSDSEEGESIKLQIVRPSVIDSVGKEVLYTSLKSCSTSSTCGANECCYNKRCWSKDLVTKCLEDAQTEGNLGIGISCNTDFQCSSLCCNRNTGKCAVHNNIISPPVLCSKSPGDSCVAKEWCRKQTVYNCKIIRTGISVIGTVTCALRCFSKQVHGTCTDGICIPPFQPSPPSFNPNNPDCSAAESPPLNVESL